MHFVFATAKLPASKKKKKKANQRECAVHGCSPQLVR